MHSEQPQSLKGPWWLWTSCLCVLEFSHFLYIVSVVC